MGYGRFWLSMGVVVVWYYVVLWKKWVKVEVASECWSNVVVLLIGCKEKG